MCPDCDLDAIQARLILGFSHLVGKHKRHIRGGSLRLRPAALGAPKRLDQGRGPTGPAGATAPPTGPPSDTPGCPPPWPSLKWCATGSIYAAVLRGHILVNGENFSLCRWRSQRPFATARLHGEGPRALLKVGAACCDSCFELLPADLREAWASVVSDAPV